MVDAEDRQVCVYLPCYIAAAPDFALDLKGNDQTVAAHLPDELSEEAHCGSPRVDVARLEQIHAPRMRRDERSHVVTRVGRDLGDRIMTLNPRGSESIGAYR